MTSRARDEWKKWKDGQLTEKQKKESLWIRFFNPEITEEQVVIRPEEAYIVSTLETNAANSRGYALYYGGQFKEMVENKKRLEKAREVYKKIDDATSPKEKWKLKQQSRPLADGLVPSDSKTQLEIIDKELKEIDRHINYSKESSASQWVQSEEATETIRHIQSAETYAKKEAYEAYAEAGISAMKKSEQLERKGYIKKPLAVAMENLFPESYGAHPDELIDLIENSRKKMAQQLKEKGYSSEEASRRAETHITATFDTGHFNMWRKYWIGNENKTIEDNDKDFNKWALAKVQELANKKIVGHLHIVDNYGYQDEHLAPGQGNTPIKEMIEIFKKAGYKGEMIVEPGADYTTDSSGFQSVMKTWSYLGSPVHGGGGGAESPRGWGQVQYGYFGQTQPPYFVFGAYSPSEEWTLWSGVPLE